ncbi:hypothetical protein KRX19_09590 [Cardiobacteriaceae bacterium TAE3-ERU3]|nr:hypothetical protein [Cardiobacteriaceae bacterium TAE3-ERU3]
MEEFALYNFESGFPGKQEFTIGKYRISVNDKQSKNIEKLKNNGGRKHSINIDGEAYTRKIDTKPGEVVETATLHVPKEDIKSSTIYRKGLERTSIDDFILFLSFATGRNVFLEGDLDGENSLCYFTRIIKRDFFFFNSIDLDIAFQKLKDSSLTNQFYNIVTAGRTNDLLALSFYVNSIINSIYDKWCRKNKKSVYDNRMIDMNEVKEQIKDSTKDILSKLGAEYDFISEFIQKRVRIDDSLPAIEKLKSFLIAHDLYPEDDDEDSYKKLRWVTLVRNKVVHNGSLYTDFRGLELDDEHKEEINVGITFLLYDIARYYFAKEIFKIDQELISITPQDIKQFFTKGSYRNMNVFDEKYTDFLVRSEKEWGELVKNGQV